MEFTIPTSRFVRKRFFDPKKNPITSTSYGVLLTSLQQVRFRTVVHTLARKQLRKQRREPATTGFLGLPISAKFHQT
jgi:hypothetical protein